MFLCELCRYAYKYKAAELAALSSSGTWADANSCGRKNMASKKIREYWTSIIFCDSNTLEPKWMLKCNVGFCCFLLVFVGFWRSKESRISKGTTQETASKIKTLLKHNSWVHWPWSAASKKTQNGILSNNSDISQVPHPALFFTSIQFRWAPDLLSCPAFRATSHLWFHWNLDLQRALAHAVFLPQKRHCPPWLMF